jgi:hypothetical protein
MHMALSKLFAGMIALSAACGSIASQQVLRPIPFVRDHQALAFDQGTQRTIVHGGTAPLGAVLGDVWARGAGAWNLEATAPGAPVLTGHAMAWLPSSVSTGLLLVVGGRLPNGGLATQPPGTIAAARKYSGNSWSDVLSSVGPSPRTEAQMVWDPSRQAAVLFGGVDANGAVLTDTWTWSESAGWTLLVGAPAPAGKLAYNGATQRVAMVSGMGAAAVHELFGANWVLRASSGSGGNHPGEFNYSVGTAPNGAGVFIFGGFRQWYWSNALTLWNGVQFSLPAAGAGPTPREGSLMVLDANRGKLLLMGGQIPHRDYLMKANDVWEFGSSGWQYVPDASSPSFRSHAGMVATPNRGGLMLHGGIYQSPTGDVNLGDSWTYLENQWLPTAGVVGATDDRCIA